MNMTFNQALKILNITESNPSKNLLQSSYRYLAKKYHPDKNPDGLLMMQNINMAYDFLLRKASNKSFPGYNPYNPKKDNLYEKFKKLGLILTRNGNYFIVLGDTYPHRILLRKHGFKWDPNNRYWWQHIF